MSAIPDLIKIGNIATQTVQDVFTHIQEPVTFSQSGMKFVLEPKGFLHSNSKLTIGLKSNATLGEKAQLPYGVGINSVVKNCRLLIGGQTISETSDWNMLQSYKSMFVPNEVMKERDQVASSQNNCARFNYKSGAGVQLQVPNTNASNIVLDNGREYDAGVLPLNAESVAGVPTDVSRYLWQQLDSEPVFTIALSDLFSVLKRNSLPLYMIKEPVSILIEFEDSIHRCIVDEGTTAEDMKTAIDVDRNECKIIADYIMYNGELMSQFAEANKSLSFQFTDYRLSKATLNQASALNQIRNVGGAGRVVSALITGINNEKVDGVADSLLGKYHSLAPINTYADADASLRRNGTLTSNVRYNDRFLFSIDRKNPAVHFHDTKEAEGMIPFVSSQLYSDEQKIWGDLNYNGTEQTDVNKGLIGKYFWQSYRLNRGERINSKGIELYSTMELPARAGDNFTQRTWIEMQKIAELKDGFMTCYFA